MPMTHPPLITGPQVAALRLLAAAGVGPHRRLQRLQVWREVKLLVARSCEREKFVLRWGDVEDVQLLSTGRLVVDTARAMRRRSTRPAWQPTRFGGAR